MNEHTVSASNSSAGPFSSRLLRMAMVMPSRKGPSSTHSPLGLL